MDNRDPLRIFDESLNTFFSSRLIIVDKTISEFLACLVHTPELIAVVGECNRTVNFERELANAMTHDNIGMRFRLPLNKRHIVALVVGLLYAFDTKEMSIVDFVTRFFSSDASHTSYMNFCEEIIRPFGEAFHAMYAGEDPEDESPTINDKRSAEPLNDSAKEDADYWLRAMLDTVISLNELPDEERRETVTMIKGLLYALELRNPMLIKLVWIGLKNTLGIQNIQLRELKEVETILLNYGVID